MIESSAPPAMTDRVERLSPVLCVLCGHPVSHYDRGVPGSKAGGMCTRASCLKDRTGKPQRVYTFHVVMKDKL